MMKLGGVAQDILSLNIERMYFFKEGFELGVYLSVRANFLLIISVYR
jgi:hypothetical protein